jgi:hypothetical protein
MRHQKNTLRFEGIGVCLKPLLWGVGVKGMTGFYRNRLFFRG